MTDSARTGDDGGATRVWPRWYAWLLGDPDKMSPGLCFFMGAVLLLQGGLGTWRFLTETGYGWAHSVQVLGPLVIAGGVFYLWAGLRLRRLRSRTDQPTSPAVH